MGYLKAAALAWGHELMTAAEEGKVYFSPNRIESCTAAYLWEADLELCSSHIEMRVRKQIDYVECIISASDIWEELTGQKSATEKFISIYYPKECDHA